MVERLFLAMPRGCLQFVIVVFPDHTHLLFLEYLLCLWCVNAILNKRYTWQKYSIYVLQQTACLVANPITVGNFARRRVGPQTL